MHIEIDRNKENQFSTSQFHLTVSLSINVVTVDISIINKTIYNRIWFDSVYIAVIYVMKSLYTYF